MLNAVPRRCARAGPRVAAALVQTEHLADALAQILDTPPPLPLASASAFDPLAAARYAARPLALRVVREACQAAAGAAAAVHSSGALLMCRSDGCLFAAGMADRLNQQ